MRLEVWDKNDRNKLEMRVENRWIRTCNDHSAVNRTDSTLLYLLPSATTGSNQHQRNVAAVDNVRTDNPSSTLSPSSFSPGDLPWSFFRFKSKRPDFVSAFHPLSPDSCLHLLQSRLLLFSVSFQVYPSSFVPYSFLPTFQLSWAECVFTDDDPQVNYYYVSLELCFRVDKDVNMRFRK